MAAIYNFTQVPLTLPLQAAVKNRHGRRVIRGRKEEREALNKGEKGEFKIKMGKGGILRTIYGDENTVC